MKLQRKRPCYFLLEIVLYQVELFVDTIKTEFYYLFKIKRIYVINGFNGGVFFNIYHFCSSNIFDVEQDLGLKKGELILASNILNKEEYENAKHIIFIGQKRDFNKRYSNFGINLNLKRQEITQCSYNKGVGVVIGNTWNEIFQFKNSGFD